MLPLTTAQLGIWLGQRLDHHSPAYNVGGYVEIHGPINADLLERACQAVMREAGTLRIRVDGDNQVVTDTTCSLPVQDLTPVESDAWMRTDMATPVDPTWEPVFACALHRIGPDEWRWYVRCHHIAIDGYSFPLVCKRIAEIYTELFPGAERSPSPFAPLQLLVQRDREYRDSADLVADREFWSGPLQGDAPTLSGRQSLRAAAYTRHSFSLPGDLAARARAVKKTWADVAIAAFASYLGLMTGTSDVRIGVPTTDAEAHTRRFAEYLKAFVERLSPEGITLAEQVSAQARGGQLVGPGTDAEPVLNGAASLGTALELVDVFDSKVLAKLAG